MPVYIIRAGETGMVKIGWADDPESRCSDLQTAHYEELRIIRVMEGPRSLEGLLHGHFGARKHRGEWFAFCPSMLEIDPSTLLLPARDKMNALPRAERPSTRLTGLGRWLDANNIRITDFAATIGTAPPTLHNWLTKRRAPCLHALARIQKATNGAVLPSDFAS
jgi:hypothetical protein